MELVTERQENNGVYCTNYVASLPFEWQASLPNGRPCKSYVCIEVAFYLLKWNKIILFVLNKIACTIVNQCQVQGHWKGESNSDKAKLQNLIKNIGKLNFLNISLSFEYKFVFFYACINRAHRMDMKKDDSIE